MKYIIFEQDLGDGVVRQTPILFPNFLTHSDVAEALTKCLGLTTARPASAGTVASPNTLRMSAILSGGSVSLNLDSHPDDFAAIRNIDYTHGLRDT